jgi:hypothetical protein
VRLFLDAHVSGKHVGAGLRQRNHDVRAVDEEHALEGLSNGDLLDNAVLDGRILVTGNVRHFVPLVVERVSRGQDHAGVLLVPNSIRHEAFGLLVSGIDATLTGSAQVDGAIEWPGCDAPSVRAGRWTSSPPVPYFCILSGRLGEGEGIQR